VHGRYDVICTASNAFTLHEAMPGSKLVICPRSGHSMFEEEISQALVDATDAFRV